MFLQRHGESATNLTKTFTCRRFDPGLTDEGKRQIEDIGTYYASQQIRGIVTSPSKRAVESAEILGSQLGIRPEVSDCLLEVDVGDLEGENECDQTLIRFFFSVIEDWLVRKKNTRFPGGESWRDVERRLKLLDTLMYSPPTIFVGHTTIFAVFLGMRGLPFNKVEDLFLPRAGIARFSHTEKKWKMDKGSNRGV